MRIYCGFLVLMFPFMTHAQSSADCLACHSDRNLTLARRGGKVSLYVSASQLQASVHSSLDCVDCHTGLNPSQLPHARVVHPVDCQTCHDVKGYGKSVHAPPVSAANPESRRHPAAACKDCHGTHGILAPTDPKSTVSRLNIASTCGRCHGDEESRFTRSAHAVALRQGFNGAPTCVDCHRAHDIEPPENPKAAVSKRNEVGVCLRCHIDNPAVRQRIGVSAGFIAGYENSIHGRVLASGNQESAVCSDCHGAHDIQEGSKSTSTVNKWNIPRTCGKCHGEIAIVYDASIHGKALRSGHLSAPSCVDCHGEHQIFAPSNPLCTVNPRNVSARVCGACHGSLRLTEKYGLAAERFQTFEDSYHGLAAREGSIQVANCASCHGYHDVKPSSDPTSSINKANLAATCGQCHRGATAAFAQGPVHLEIEPKGSVALLYWIRHIYLGLIVVLIGGMILHNGLDFVKKSRLRLAMRRGVIPPLHCTPDLYLRMTLSERLQHGVLLVSFFVLVITGFMLKFPDSWWVAPIRHWSAKLFEVRSVLHRLAGVCLILASLYHAGYLSLSRRGRLLVRDLVPRLEDARDGWRLVLYNLGLRKIKPQFGRFGYVEKLEYWALVWGTAVMAITGIILWFDTYFINILTKLGWDAARLIHYYEAWLATLAIVIWHFYYVVFNPSVYPMNAAWLTGMLSEEEMVEEHPRELEEIRAARQKGAEADTGSNSSETPHV